MNIKFLWSGVFALLLIAITGCSPWKVHDTSRPLPAVITPAEQPGRPPSDAVILFDGKDLSNWVSEKDGGPAKWKVENGFLEAVKKTGNIRTKQAFGDCQLHIEWASPAEVNGASQDRGNSGVFLMSKYEVQVLDSYDNITYADGQAGAVYGQNPPLVNASRPPGQWQSYDIIFHRPVFKLGLVVKPATITVLQNGVLVQDNFEIKGATVWKKRAKYSPHADKMPLMLQDHDQPVRYRNIWLRELPESKNK
ncbi:MAG: DUF1080 domain-containing protein [Phycisphaerae bacterium]|nr:DUF1080 domain-containing protein [Phycisphaerae bacterium]